LLAVLLAISLSTACAARSAARPQTRSVIFSQQAARTDWPGDSGASVVRVYFDRNGDLYPVGDSTLPDWATMREAIKKTREKEYSLWGYFQGSEPGRRAWDAVRTPSGLRPSGSGEAAWAFWQGTLRTAVVARINSLLRTEPGSTPRSLVVLVHGFNVPADAHEYQIEKARRAVLSNSVAQAAMGDPPVFLQVAWDGMEGDGVIPRTAWGRAQYTAPVIGLELRRLLAAVDSAAPVRVIAHSLGALVVGNAL